MRGTLPEVAAHLGISASQAYGLQRDGQAIRKVRRNVYETDLEAGQGTSQLNRRQRNVAARAAGQEPEPELPPIDRYGFSLVIDIEVPADAQELGTLEELAGVLLRGLAWDPETTAVALRAGALERGRRHTMFIPRRAPAGPVTYRQGPDDALGQVMDRLVAEPGVPHEAGDEEEQEQETMA